MKKKKEKYFRRTFQENLLLKQEFFRRLVYIIICAIPIFIMANEKSWLRFIVLVFFIVAISQVITLVQLSPLIIDAFFPPKTNSEKEPTKFNKFIYPFSSFFVFFSLILLIFEIRNLENTFLGTKFFWNYGLIGIGIAIITTLFLIKFSPETFNESKRRYTVVFGTFVGLFLITPSISSFLNHYYSNNEIKCNYYKIIRKSSGNKTYSIYVNISSKNEECFKIKKPLYESLADGDTLNICSKEGWLGYKYATGFNKTNN